MSDGPMVSLHVAKPGIDTEATYRGYSRQPLTEGVMKFAMCEGGEETITHLVLHLGGKGVAVDVVPPIKVRTGIWPCVDVGLLLTESRR